MEYDTRGFDTYRFRVEVKHLTDREIFEGIPLKREPETRGECKLFLAVLYGIQNPTKLQQIGFFLNGFTPLLLYQKLVGAAMDRVIDDSYTHLPLQTNREL